MSGKTGDLKAEVKEDRALKLFKKIVRLEGQCCCKHPDPMPDEVYWMRPCKFCQLRWDLCGKLGTELKRGPWEFPFVLGPKDTVDPTNQRQLDARKRYLALSEQL